MRIFFFITKSEQGGAQTHVAQLTQWLVGRGHEIVVMSAPGGWLALEVERLGARFISNAHLDNTASPLRLWKSIRTFLRAVESFKPDVVACHSTMAGLVGRLSLRSRIPTIFTAHGWGFTQGAPAMRRLLLPFLERMAGHFSSKIICVSRNDFELAHRHHIAPDENLVQIYNGIDLPLPPPPFHLSTSATFPPPPPSLHVFFIGRLAPPKNPFLLMEAFARLDRALQEQTRITIIGDGPDRGKLEELIQTLKLQTHIELAGSLPREHVLARLREEADLFVLLSRWEGFPYSILEAMAAGVPVIASRVGGIPEMLEHGGGILLKHEDAETLARALTLLIQDETYRVFLASQARLIAEQQFSVERMCERTFALYLLFPSQPL
ncbi:glycosyltransferase family 1 protein [Patescibacteria group bacterium]|nr:MAG: glycosyltransferase family 1 protein [Patescibacteria group bacterium]